MKAMYKGEANLSMNETRSISIQKIYFVLGQAITLLSMSETITKFHFKCEIM